ncbi:hypothetical protein Btru_077058 [Bulinus truncatus]|nr:hypothetical protein Btru_077058 [Bulinus truncatus]
MANSQRCVQYSVFEDTRTMSITRCNLTNHTVPSDSCELKQDQTTEQMNRLQNYVPCLGTAISAISNPGRTGNPIKMKRQNRPSGYQQRQAKKAKDAALNAMKGSLLKWTQKPETVKSSGCIDAEGTSHEQQLESHCSSDSEQPRDRNKEQTDIEEQSDAAIATPIEEEFETSAASTISNLLIFNDVSSWQIPVPDTEKPFAPHICCKMCRESTTLEQEEPTVSSFWCANGLEGRKGSHY